MGLQLAVVEYARNVVGITNAHSDEMDESCACCDKDAHVISVLPDQEKIRAAHGYIGTQRLGDFACAIDKNHFVKNLYERVGRPDEYERSKLHRYDESRLGVLNQDDFVVFERHRHRREVEPKFHEKLLAAGMQFPGVHRTSDGTLLVEIISLPNHPYFVASQFHPEFTTNYLKPNSLFLGFAEAVRTGQRLNV